MKAKWQTLVDWVSDGGGPDFENGWTFAIAIAFLILGLITGLLLAPSANGSVKKKEEVVSHAASARETPEFLEVSAIGEIVTIYNYAQAVENARLADLAARRAAWERLHNCEQGDDWYVDGRGGNGMWFQGGLGIGAELYQSIAGHSANQDSPEQQIAVGEIVLSRFGRGAWQCPAP